MVDSARVEAIIRDAAAEYIMPRFNRLTTSDIREKRPGDLVTIADIEAENAIAPLLVDLLPNSCAIGEEAVAQNPGLLGRLREEGSIWLIDPIDGTANFAAGISLFAVMVALVQHGEIVASWIFDPVKGVMAIAEAGGGAWQDGNRLHVANSARPEAMSGSVSLKFGNRHLARRIAGRSDLVGSVFSFRCAGQEYLALASGSVHFALYYRLMPWDHAAGFMLHREAGGFGRRLDRGLYSPRIHDGGLLLAPDEESWDTLHATLMGEEDTPPKT